jgi:hypothetical protein
MLRFRADIYPCLFVKVDRVLDIVGTKQNKIWRSLIEFKVSGAP